MMNMRQHDAELKALIEKVKAIEGIVVNEKDWLTFGTWDEGGASVRVLIGTVLTVEVPNPDKRRKPTKVEHRNVCVVSTGQRMQIPTTQLKKVEYKLDREERLMSTLEWELGFVNGVPIEASNNKAIDSFIEDLKKNPAHAFEWAQDAMRAAAKIEVGAQVQNILDWARNTAKELAAAGTPVTVDAMMDTVHAEIVRRTLRAASSVGSCSTSPVHNAMHHAICAEWPQWVERTEPPAPRESDAK